MRRELTVIIIAVAMMITLAFVVPLGLTARANARIRGFDVARAAATELVPLVAVEDEAGVLARLAVLNAGDGLAVSVVRDGQLIGEAAGPSSRLERAVAERRSGEGDVPGGGEVVLAVVGTDGQTGAVRAFVPEAELRRGLVRSLAVLLLVAAVLAAVAVVVADRLALRLSRPVTALAAAARRVGAGEVGVQVPVEGPAELAATASAFNAMSGQVAAMVERERAMVGELAHRLRTPMTRLRVDLDRVADPELAEVLFADVDALTHEVNAVINAARGRIERLEPVDVVEACRQRFEWWSALAVEEERPCAFEAMVGRAALMVDRELLDAALDVLMENVFAHTAPGTEFRVSVSGGSWGAEIVVEDAGGGFDSSMVPAGRSSGGSTGLGLSIVRQLADVVGGLLSVEPSALGGARVRVLLEPDLKGRDLAPR